MAIIITCQNRTLTYEIFSNLCVLITFYNFNLKTKKPLESGSVILN